MSVDRAINEATGWPVVGHEDRILAETESVCPHCLARVPAARVARGDDVYLTKSCPEHGGFTTVIWRGPPDYASWLRPKAPTHPRHPLTAVRRGCPFDCGLCPEHRQASCCVLLEVTQRCDLRCPVCFADANARSGRGRPADPDLAEIERWYRRLLDTAGPVNIQLSGGEPCVRDDLPEIIALGRSLGFTFFQVNTNGLRLSRDAGYLQRLRDAGLSTVFLQFDGTTQSTHLALRGRRLADRKRAAIERCADARVGVVLVPTLVPGVNTDDIGGIIEFALGHVPAVRGVHFQPISYFGRYPHMPDDSMRITIPEIIRAVEEQTGGRIAAESFVPPGGENALCSFHGNFVVMPDGRLQPLTRLPAAAPACCGESAPVEAPARCGEPASGACCGEPAAAGSGGGAARSRDFVARQWSAPASREDPVPVGPSLGGWDAFLGRARTHTFAISGMAFQDAWNLDLERLRECYIHTVTADTTLVPFCAYNLTDADGRPLYRRAEVPR